MKRCAYVIGLKEEKKDEYLRLHRNVRPAVNAMISECNIRNFSIFHRRLPDGKIYLFAYYEYVGDDFAADTRKMADDPTTQEWWAVTKPCQEPLPDIANDEWWAPMEEAYYNP